MDVDSDVNRTLTTPASDATTHDVLDASLWRPVTWRCKLLRRLVMQSCKSLQRPVMRCCKSMQWPVMWHYNDYGRSTAAMADVTLELATLQFVVIRSSLWHWLHCKNNYYYFWMTPAGLKIFKAAPVSTLEGERGRERFYLLRKRHSPIAALLVGRNVTTQAPSNNSNIGAPSSNNNTGAPSSNNNIGAPSSNNNIGAPSKNNNTCTPSSNRNTSMNTSTNRISKLKKICDYQH